MLHHCALSLLQSNSCLNILVREELISQSCVKLQQLHRYVVSSSLLYLAVQLRVLHWSPQQIFETSGGLTMLTMNRTPSTWMSFCRCCLRAQMIKYLSIPHLAARIGVCECMCTSTGGSLSLSHPLARFNMLHTHHPAMSSMFSF